MARTRQSLSHERSHPNQLVTSTTSHEESPYASCEFDIQENELAKNTVDVLRKDDKYKLFRFEISISDDEESLKETDCIFRMLEDMPDMIIDALYVYEGNNNTFQKLLDLPNFKTKQDLLKVLYFKESYDIEESEPYEYLSKVNTGDKNMKNY